MSVASFASRVAALVDCGGHYDADCSACAAAHGSAWCNGDCAWVGSGFLGGQCVPKTPAIGVPLDLDSTQNMYYSLSGFILTGVIMLCYACAYNQKVIKGPPEFPKVNSFSSPARKGLFECLRYPETCLHVTFCLPVIAAKNYYAADVCPFWPGCLLSFLLSYSPLYFLNACVRAVISGRVQDNLGLEHHCLWDCVLALFCYPCDVGRESLEIDSEVGADIKCCCNVNYSMRVVAESSQIVEKIERQCGCWVPGQ